MKKYVSMVIFLGTLVLGGCATNIPLGSIVIGGTTYSSSEIIADVQKASAQVCGFVPTIETVTGILASFIPGAVPINQTASKIVSSICSVVVPARASISRHRRVSLPMYNGITINGYFIR